MGSVEDRVIFLGDTTALAAMVRHHAESAGGAVRQPREIAPGVSMPRTLGAGDAIETPAASGTIKVGAGLLITYAPHGDGLRLIVSAADELAADNWRGLRDFLQRAGLLREVREGGQVGKAVIFAENTTLATLGAWFEQHVKDVSRSTKDGGLIHLLKTPRHKEKAGRVTITGILLPPRQDELGNRWGLDESGNVWMNRDLGEVITFDLLPLSAGVGWVEIVPTCHAPDVPEVADYYRDLLAAIVERFPETPGVPAAGDVAEHGQAKQRAPRKRRNDAPQAGVEERVRKVHELVKSGVGLYKACDHEHTDPHTYRKWCKRVTGDDPD